jgi:flagellar basal-body rod protein FlgC
VDGDREMINDPLSAAMKVAGAGLAAQSARLRIVSENMANAQATARTPGGEPYARKTISFTNELDRLEVGWKRWSPTDRIIV